MVQGKLRFGPPASSGSSGSSGGAQLSGGAPSRVGDEPPTVLTVHQAVEAANRCVQQGIPPTWIEGEISNLKFASSGHVYFTLKDAKAALPSAMWRSSVSRLRFRLEEGQRLRMFGRMGIYVQQGRFQFYAERAEAIGLGDMMLQLEQLKKKLSAEGLFDPDRRRPLPVWPRVIGVVTSPTGAVIHDIARVVRRRCPSRILLSPAPVQGDRAPEALIAALDRLQRCPEVDVIIIARGGGSAVDLWSFNHEGLARAVAACAVPIVSAIGHEVDVSLCDLVADCRAATPSQAGEFVVPDRVVVRRELRSLDRRLLLACERRVLDERARHGDLVVRLERRGHGVLRAQRDRWRCDEDRLLTAGRGLCLERRRRLKVALAGLHERHPRARIRRHRDRLVKLEARLDRAILAMGSEVRQRLARAAGKLDALSPLRVLERGYAVATDPRGAVVIDATAVSKGDRLGLRLHRGLLEVEVREVKEIAVTRGDGGEAGAEAGARSR